MKHPFNRMTDGEKLAAFQTKNLNMWVDAPEVWIPDDDVAACEAAVRAGKEAAASIGKLTAANVMKRPVPPIGDVVSVHDVDCN